MSANHTPSSVTARAPTGPGRLVLVVGPSGAGKDTLISGAKAACSGNPTIVFPRRIVTRPASDAEDHDSLSDIAFDRAVNDGAFAFWWQAHGLKYGVPLTIDDDVRAGRILVCNVSRGIVGDVRAHYDHVDTVLVTAPPEILAIRLSDRSRNTDGSLAERMDRNGAFTEFAATFVIENTGAPSVAVQKLLDAIKGKIR